MLKCDQVGFIAELLFSWEDLVCLVEFIFVDVVGEAGLKDLRNHLLRNVDHHISIWHQNYLLGLAWRHLESINFLSEELQKGVEHHIVIRHLDRLLCGCLRHLWRVVFDLDDVDLDEINDLLFAKLGQALRVVIIDLLVEHLKLFQ